MRAAVERQAELGLQPWRAAGRQLAHERVEALVALVKHAVNEHLKAGRGKAGLFNTALNSLALAKGRERERRWASA
jgi:hypothetical protein